MGNSIAKEHDLHKHGNPTVSQLIDIGCWKCFQEAISKPGVNLNTAPPGGLPPLIMCMRMGTDRLDWCEELLSRGAHGYVQDPRDGATALHLACWHLPEHKDESDKQLRFMRRLIECKADVNARAKNQCTPAHVLAMCPADTRANMSVIQGRDFRLVDAMKFLKENGADVNAKDELGRTPLDLLSETEKKGNAFPCRRTGFAKLGCV